MAVISMKQLLEAGVHFGHQTRRWNPKMAPYIFTERNGIYIIDLQKTVRKIDEAYMFVRDMAMEGKSILFVGTKKQAQESIEAEAKRCGMFYVNNRWLGGTLTNFRTIQHPYRPPERHRRDGEERPVRRPAQEGSRQAVRRSAKSSLKNLGGIREMKQASRRAVHRRPAQGAHRRGRGPRAGHPDRGHRRHQLRPRRDRLRHPRQRRRHPRREADLPASWRTRCWRASRASRPPTADEPAAAAAAEERIPIAHAASACRCRVNRV